MPFFIVLFFYITISIYQISAVTDTLKLIFMVQSTFLEGVLFIISLFLTFTPFLGPILGIIGATFVWEWNILFSAENKIFHSQTNVAPMMPKIGPRKGVKVRKREMINKTPSRKVL